MAGYEKCPDHGSLYARGCEACQTSRRDYQRANKRRVAPGTVNAARARTHLRELRSGGLRYSVIARESGLSYASVYKVATGGTDRIRPETEKAILGVSARAASQRVAVEGERRARTAPQLRAAYEPPAFWEGETDWMKRGACRNDDVPTWLFFAGRGDTRTVEAAKAVCAGCGVQDDCLQYALRNNAVGIWGGTSGADRRGMKPRSTKCRDCGVEVPWKRQNQQRCDECYRVHRSQQQQRWHHEVGKFRQEASA